MSQKAKNVGQKGHDACEMDKASQDMGRSNQDSSGDLKRRARGNHEASAAAFATHGSAASHLHIYHHYADDDAKDSAKSHKKMMSEHTFDDYPEDSSTCCGCCCFLILILVILWAVGVCLHHGTTAIVADAIVDNASKLVSRTFAVIGGSP